MLCNGRADVVGGDIAALAGLGVDQAEVAANGRLLFLGRQDVDDGDFVPRNAEGVDAQFAPAGAEQIRDEDRRIPAGRARNDDRAASRLVGTEGPFASC